MWLIAALLLALLAPRAAHAQRVKPWLPASSDSMLALASDAKAAFRANRGDSVTGDNIRAYEIVQRMAQRILISLGRNNFPQSPAVEGVLDSLGLDTSIAFDPEQPNFVLLMVRNPYRFSAQAVGFLYWFRGSELRVQGVVFRGGQRPAMRAWWSGYAQSPYHIGVIDAVRDEADMHRFTLLALTPQGSNWNAVQYEGNGPDLRGTREVVWADINHDGRPELVTYGPALPDSLVAGCTGCPERTLERVYVQRDGLFELEDNRVLPSPFATFVLFIHLLQEGNRTAASRLVIDPRWVDTAIQQGWATRSRGTAWELEYGEPNQAWPRFLGLRHIAAKQKPRYVVRFTQRDLRWVILEWKVSEPSSAAAPRDTVRAVPSTKPKASPSTKPKGSQ